MIKKYIPITVIILVVIGLLIFLPNKPHLEVLKDPSNLDDVYTKDELSSDLLGASRPSDYKTTLAESLSATASTTEDITVSSVTLVDGQTLTSADVGDYICLKINPNASTREIACCTGGISGTTFLTCKRGMSFKGDDAVYSGNEKSHSPGETVIISNDDTYLREQFAGLDADNTFYGTQTFASTTAISRINIGDGAITYDKRVYAYNGETNLPYLMYDESANVWSFSNDGVSSTAIGSGASVYTAGNGLNVASSIFTISTSSLSGLRFDSSGNLQIATSSGTGIYIDTDNTFKVATSTNFTWTGTHSFGSSISVTGTSEFTGTSTFNGNTIGCSGQYYLTASTTFTGTTLPQPVYLATSTSAVNLSDADSEFAKDFIGFAISDATNGDNVLIQTQGIVDGFTGLDDGLEYFVQDAVGTIGVATGTASIYVGKAISATEILVNTSRADEFLLSTSVNTSGSIAVPAYTTKIIINLVVSDEESDYNTVVLTKNGLLEGKVQACNIGTGTCESNSTLTLTWDPSTNLLTGAITSGSGSGTAYFYR